MTAGVQRRRGRWDCAVSFAVAIIWGGVRFGLNYSLSAAFRNFGCYGTFAITLLYFVLAKGILSGKSIRTCCRRTNDEHSPPVPVADVSVLGAAQEDPAESLECGS